MIRRTNQNFHCEKTITISRHNIEYQSSIGILLLLTEDYLTGKVASVSQYSKSLTVHSHVKRFSTSVNEEPQTISKHHRERSSKIRILHSISRIMYISSKISIFISLASVLYIGDVAGLSFEDSEEGRENYYNFIGKSNPIISFHFNLHHPHLLGESLHSCFPKGSSSRTVIGKPKHG